MFSGVRQSVPTLDATKGLMTKAALYNTNQDEPEVAYDDFELYRNPLPSTLSQQLIDDLAELRRNTTIVGRNPAEEALCRLMRPLFEPGASLAWPPAPHTYDCPDRYSEESNSPSVSFTSQPNGHWNERVSPGYLHSQPHSYDGPYYSPVFRPQNAAPAPAPRIISHIIGEDDPFNPFSYDIVLEDKNQRKVETPNGTIFAPVPQLQTAAALASFEALAMALAAEGAVEKEPGVDRSDSTKEPSMSSSKETELHAEALI
ncbi:hypothetical protein C0992_008690 [Termitomyces sp. T32_za158]|nr:hypothetical protein C0992_008690 [Termitomyces sp. T32_za158]